MSIKDQVGQFTENVKKSGEDFSEEMKSKAKELQDDSMNLLQKIQHSFNKLDAKSILAFIIGIGGVGLALIPGLGFMVGLLVGTLLDDLHRNKLQEALKSSSNELIKVAHKISDAIQKNWDVFMKAFDHDMENMQKKGEDLKEDAQHLEDKYKDFLDKK